MIRPDRIKTICLHRKSVVPIDQVPETDRNAVVLIGPDKRVLARVSLWRDDARRSSQLSLHVESDPKLHSVIREEALSSDVAFAPETPLVLENCPCPRCRGRYAYPFSESKDEKRVNPHCSFCGDTGSVVATFYPKS